MAPHNSVEAASREPVHGNMAQPKKAFTQPGKPFFLYSTLPYYLIYFIYIMGFIGLRYYENPYWMITLVYFGFPILDCISHDWLNPDSEQSKELEHDLWFKLPLFGLVLMDNAVFWYAIYFISQMEVSWVFLPGALFLVGSMAGHHFLVAHEIFHKRDNFSRIVGTLTVMKSLYMHFFIEHNYGHHKNVATPVDPATARYGESIYQFLPRTIIGSFKSAWNIEKRRMLKIKGFKTHWMPHNKMIWFTATKILIPILVFTFLGLKGLLIYLVPAAISVVIFETVNYIEHYGLARKELAPGEFEKINVTHSWNAPHRFSNYLLLKLQRHSDHHENSYKPYQMLLSKDDSPMLPHGYLVCILISFFPNIWFRIIDRKLLAYKEGRQLTEEEDKLNNYDSSMVFITLGVIFASLLTIHYSFAGKF